MYRQIVIIGLMLVVSFALLPSVDAQEDDPILNPQNPSGRTGQWDDTGSTTTPQGSSTGSGGDLTQSNKFLAAEVSRQMKVSKEEMLTEMQEYQDDNFMIFDQRMTGLMDDLKWKITLGAIGGMLLAMGIASYLIIKSMRDNNYERYLEKVIEGKMIEAQGDNSLDQMQQRDWYPQVPQQTLGMAVGQEQAYDMTQMNQWQAQPAYDGAWRAPIDAQPEYAYQEQQNPQQPQQQQQQQQDWDGFPQSWDNVPPEGHRSYQ